MTNSTRTSPATHSIATVARSAHLAELLRALPELIREHIAAAAKVEACLQLIALSPQPALAHATAPLDAEAFTASNPVRLAEQSARAAMRRRLARALDAKLDDLVPDRSDQHPSRYTRVRPTREERLRRLEEKKQRELAECRARSAERHLEQRRQSLSAAKARRALALSEGARPAG